MQQADGLPPAEQAGAVVDFPTRPRSAPALAAAAEGLLTGVGSEDYLDGVNRHRALHQASTERLFAQNEALAGLVRRQRDDVESAAREVGLLREEAVQLRRAVSERDRRIADLTAANGELVSEVDRVTADLHGAYEMIDGQRLAAERFLSEAMAVEEQVR